MIGPLELRRELHHAHGLAIAFGLWHSEVAMQLLLRVAAFLLADDHHRLAVEEGHARDDGGIVGEGAVAVNFLEIREQTLDVVEAVRTLWMAGKLHPFPGWIDGGLRGGRCGLIVPFVSI